MKKRRYNCPAEMTLSLFDGKWKVVLLWNLRRGPKRFGELRRLTPGITAGMLAQCLRELEDHRIVQRKVLSDRPLAVEYALSSRGETLKPIVKSLVKWGLEHQHDYVAGEFGMATLMGK